MNPMDFLDLLIFEIYNFLKIIKKTFTITKKHLKSLKISFKGCPIIISRFFAKMPTARHRGVVDATNHIFSKIPKFELSHGKKIWPPDPYTEISDLGEISTKKG